MKMSDDVTAGMYALKPAWHHKGNVMAEYPATWDEALKAADINWIGMSHPTGYLSVQAGGYLPADGWQTIVREDIGLVLGCQPDSYQFINNHQLGEVIEALLEQAPNGYKYECLFELLHGRKIVCTLKLGSPVVLGRDSSQFYHYVVVWARHDGKGGIKVIPAYLRVECQNMLTAAETSADRSEVSITIRHRANWQQRLNEAKEVFALAMTEGDTFAKLAVEMSTTYITENQKEWFKVHQFPEPPVHMRTTARMNHLDQARQSWEKIYNSSTCASIKDTTWGLAQATIEYTDHVKRARTPDTRINRQISPSQEKRRVLTLARKSAHI
jgi:phage/plasmid-like protein (TIGR03299 family)